MPEAAPGNKVEALGAGFERDVSGSAAEHSNARHVSLAVPRLDDGVVHRREPGAGASRTGRPVSNGPAQPTIGEIKDRIERFRFRQPPRGPAFGGNRFHVSHVAASESRNPIGGIFFPAKRGNKRDRPSVRAPYRGDNLEFVCELRNLAG